MSNKADQKGAVEEDTKKKDDTVTENFEIPDEKSVNKLKYRPKINIYEGIKKVLSQNKIYSDWPK